MRAKTMLEYTIDDKMMINDLQQRLALKDLENVRLREALEFYASRFKYGSSWSSDDKNHVMEDKGEIAKQALSTPPTQDDLDSFIKERLGEPIAYEVTTSDNRSFLIEEPVNLKNHVNVPLYALRKAE